MLSGVCASFEGFLPAYVNELKNKVVSNGGHVYDMLTLHTTHLIVNDKRQQGFQEARCNSGAHQAWILNDLFITQSITAGIKLQEFQFTIKRYGNQDELESPLEIHDDDDDGNQNLDENELIDNDIIPELEDILNQSEGGQVWAIDGIDSLFNQISVKYILGSNEKLQKFENTIKVIKNHNVSNQKLHHSTKKIKKKGKRTKITARKYAIKQKQKNDISINNNHHNNTTENDNLRSDEELFICAVPWNQNTIMVSKEGKLWFKSGKNNPYIMNYQPDISICSVACGKAHAIALTINGQVYSWGSSYSGQLGHGNLASKANPTRIKKVIGNIPIIQISACGDSSGVLTRLGGIYMWGGNRDGKLGTGNQKQYQIPVLIHFPDGFEASVGPICKLLCGNTHSMALTKNGNLFSWGSNRYGQLGRYHKDAYSCNPELVTNINNIVSASCGLFHSGVVDNIGNLYTWGLARKGALGHGTVNINELIPKKVTWFNDNNLELSVVECGEYLTSCIEGNTGEIYICGSIGDNTQYLHPIKIEKVLSVTDIYCNKSTITFLIRDSNVLLQRHSIEGNSDPFQALLKYLCSNSSSIKDNLHNIKTKDGNTLLHLACLFNQPKIVEYILFKFPNFNTKELNNNGLASIHICTKYDRVECLELLLLHPNTDINQTDLVDKNTALHYSIISYSENCMKLLVYHGAEKSIFNSQKYTPLHVAIKFNSNKLYRRFLVSHAASIVDKDNTNVTPLGYCSWEERLSLKEIAETNDVFISYAHIDIDFALKIRKSLNCYSLRCWMDDWRLEAGGDWRTAIGNGLTKARIVIFIASKNSVISEWCLKELYLAIELNRKILIVIQDNVDDTLPLLDIQISTLLSHSKLKDIFDFSIENTNYSNTVELLARRTHGLLAYTGSNKLSSSSLLKLQENTLNDNNNNINIRKLIAKKSLYVCLGYLDCDKTFTDWIQSHLKDHRIKSINSRDISIDSDERLVISNAWVYILVLSPEILKDDKIQQQLTWIESSQKVHLILLYFDAEKDYMDLFPKRFYSSEQLRKISELFSFCINDPPWFNQLIYTLNLLRKQSLLDRHLDLLMKRLEEYRQQTAQLDAQLSLLQTNSNNNQINKLNKVTA